MISRLGSIIALASIASLSHAQLARYSPTSETGLSFSVNIPTSTSDSNSGPIYIQVRGPSSKQWIAVGQGSQMAGANIFVIYADGAGNVTVSPRLGQGHFEPDFDSDAQVELLEGSGIVDGEMIANFRCDTCLSWSGGEMEVSDSSSPWIWSVKDGDPLDDTSPSANIQQHDVHGNFQLDLGRATGGNSNNPFVEAAVTNPSGTSTGSPSGTSTGPVSSNTSEGDSDDGGNVGASDSNPFAHIPNWLKIHGILMGLAFAVLFPSGAILVRVLPAGTGAKVHMAVQIVALILAIAGLAYGVMLAQDLRYLTETHPIIGMVVMGGLFFQPILGLIHHRIYLSKGKRTLFTYVHTWWGRALLILGMVNGGLGLALADNSKGGKTAYAVIAGVFGGLWLGIAIQYHALGGSQRAVAKNAKREKNGASDGENVGGISDRENVGGIST